MININDNESENIKSRITISKIEELDVLVAFTSSYFHNNNISGDIAKTIHVIIDEIAMNVITHGFAASNLNYYFTTEITSNTDEIIVTFYDNGIEFNPITYDAKIDFGLPIAQREIGGLGLIIVKHYADKLEYRYDMGVNTLMFTKKIANK